MHKFYVGNISFDIINEYNNMDAYVEQIVYGSRDVGAKLYKSANRLYTRLLL